MSNQRQRVFIWAGCGLIAIWGLAYVGYSLSKNFKMTSEKVDAYVKTVDLGKLSATERARRLKRLAEMLNQLSLEERGRMQSGQLTKNWFMQMTDAEKGEFIEATLPTGFKQMLTSFEKIPEDKRRKLVDDVLKRMREDRTGTTSGNASGTNRPPQITPELEAKVRMIGLKSFYSDSSAQTKAELAPILEEIQRSMQNGRFNRGR